MSQESVKYASSKRPRSKTPSSQLPEADGAFHNSSSFCLSNVVRLDPDKGEHWRVLSVRGQCAWGLYLCVAACTAFAHFCAATGTICELLGFDQSKIDTALEFVKSHRLTKEHSAQC